MCSPPPPPRQLSILLYYCYILHFLSYISAKIDFIDIANTIIIIIITTNNDTNAIPTFEDRS